ncbi:MAG TPA: carotenoid biosynthesis protein [Fimbriimonadaceae bacterium]|nr:carotenoid biosynthesis protein [Fimbriimonadaceae bacterium]
MRQMKVQGPFPFAFQLYGGLVAFAAAGSLGSHVSGFDPGWIAPIVAALMILSGAGVMLTSYSGPRWVLVGVLVLGAGSEVLGLYTGFPFGVYSYTSAWWPTIVIPGNQPFPLLLPLAWLMMTGSAWALASRFSSQPGVVAVLSGLAAALIDLPMEAVMVGPLGYWAWAEPALPFGAPLSNFLGWWLVSGLAAYALSRAQPRGVIPRAEMVWVAVLFGLFLALVAFLNLLFWAGGSLLAISAVFAALGRLPGPQSNS